MALQIALVTLVLSSGADAGRSTVNGSTVKAVAVMGKQRCSNLFNRVTGEPVFPIEERPVPQSDVLGEKTSATQPFPTGSSAIRLHGRRGPESDRFTPALHAEALKMLRATSWADLQRRRRQQTGRADRSFRSSGGTNWPGGSVRSRDAHRLRPVVRLCGAGLLPPPNKEFSDLRTCRPMRSPACATSPALAKTSVPMRRRSQRRRRGRRCRRPATRQPTATRCAGLPLLTPPYGRLSAINLECGEILWQVAHGGDAGQRAHHRAEGADGSRTGQSGAVGALVTKSW